MGQLSERIAELTRHYGSDPGPWQHEIHALAALEESDPKLALERFHALKRRLAQLQREQLLRELRRYAFALDVPAGSAQGYPLKEIESDIRDASRALAHARAIEAALAEEDAHRAALRLRTLPLSAPLAAARWDALAPLATLAEERRRTAAREARLDARLQDARRRAAKLDPSTTAPDPGLAADALDRALHAFEGQLRDAEQLRDAHDAAVAPLRAPEVAAYRHASRRALEQEARALKEARDVAGLRALTQSAEALRREAAGLAAKAARSRRAGTAPPPRERRPGDTIDGYG